MKAASGQKNYILETKRLRLREFTLNDSNFIIELLNSPEWIEFIGDKNVRTETQAIEYLENGPIKSYAQNGYGLSLVETKDSLPIGMCGIIKRDSLENPDIGFAFLKEFTGKGYAYEMASATLAYAVDELKISKISAITLPHNTRSINLLEKIGMKLIKSFTSQNGEELLLFEK
ncbi:MAG TPA: GNAT family N-acetyltransferase [Flavisolibacter sp.]|nr:GNAT family N-acetyltransferase [Flavisolibacter sp.]